MSASTKLSTSVKALICLAKAFPEPKTSSEISKSVSVNASKLRKILSLLVRQEIVKSNFGSRGGFILNKPPEKLHLQEIYCAIEDRKAFHLHITGANNSAGSFNERVNDYFLDLFAEIQEDIENKMRSITLKSIMDKIYDSKI
ncbi:MAG: Rrf2 family transcriptional regulator [Ignavibacteriaceae bacterium]